MIWDKPEPGDNKYCIRFAFLPTIIRDKYIWSDFYKIEKVWDGYHNKWEKTGRKFFYEEEEE